MGGDFLTRLLTPSPVMHWLLMLFPLTVTVSGIFGAAERHSGNRRLALWAAALTVWLFVPVTIRDPLAARLALLATVLGWTGLVGFWARHVWNHWPSPVWAHVAVVSHLVAIALGAVVAMVRAGLG